MAGVDYCGVMDFPRIRLGSEVELGPGGRLEALRLELERRLGRAVGGAEGQLAAGLLLGRDVALEPALRGALQATGTSHLLAVSGFNVAVIGGVVLALGVWVFERRWAVALAALVVALYTLPYRSISLPVMPRVPVSGPPPLVTPRRAGSR